MANQYQQVPLIVKVGNISNLTSVEEEEIKGYIERETIFDVVFVDSDGEQMKCIGCLVPADGAPVITVVKDGSVVKAGVSLGAPVISGATLFEEKTEVTIEAEGASIFYTTDGSTPTEDSTEYTAPFEVDNTTTVKAIAVKGTEVSEVASETFTKGVFAPVIAGETPFESSTEVEITASEGTTIYYTDDGTTPTSASTEYTDKLTLSATTTIKAIAVKGGLSSAVSSKTFTKS